MESKKGSLIVALIVLLSAFYATLSVVPITVKATTLYVGGPGPGNYTRVQDAIDAANPGDSVYVYSGMNHEHIVIDKTLSLIGEDRRTTVINGSATGSVILVYADGVFLTGFTVTNGGSNLGDSGIRPILVQNCEITDVTMSNSSIGIYVQDSVNTTIVETTATFSEAGVIIERSSGNVIMNNTFSDINATGVSVYDSYSSTINNNSFNGAWLGISLSNNFTVSMNSGMRGSVSNSQNGIVSNNTGNGVRVSSSSNNTVAYNTLSGPGYYGIELGASSRITVHNNTMVSHGIHIWGQPLDQWNTHTISTSNTVNGKPVYYLKDVAGGTIPSGAGQVILANSTQIVIENQDLSDGSVGIGLAFSSNNRISNNTISLNKNYGALFWHSDHNIIENNIISENYDGIVFAYAIGNTIDNNTISSSDLEGGFFSNAINNTITNNTISDNVDGLHFFESDSNTVTNNIISLNRGYGLRLRWSYAHRIHHNDFIDNSGQAYDNLDTNQWDDGYPSGGNCWSDYAGPDIFSGPGQNQSGSDGIGDTPYVIDINTQDRYPLMFPIGFDHPRPPESLHAYLSGENLENVSLTWSPSPDDGMGFKSAKGYRIFRNITYHPNGLGYGLIASLPNGTSVFQDILTGEGDSNNYFYRVCVIDLNNNTTCASNQAAKFTRPLSKGPNLLSIPLIQSDETTQTVLQTISYDNAWSFDSINEEWISFSKSKPYGGSLDRVNRIMSIWVNVTEDSNLTVAGVVPTTTTINLRAGWNLVGFPSFGPNYTVADLKASVSVQRIEGFDDSAPPYFLRVMVDGDYLQAGFGYWIRVGSEVSWTIGNS